MKNAKHNIEDFEILINKIIESDRYPKKALYPADIIVKNDFIFKKDNIDSAKIIKKESCSGENTYCEEKNERLVLFLFNPKYQLNRKTKFPLNLVINDSFLYENIIDGRHGIDSKTSKNEKTKINGNAMRFNKSCLEYAIYKKNILDSMKGVHSTNKWQDVISRFNNWFDDMGITEKSINSVETMIKIDTKINIIKESFNKKGDFSVLKLSNKNYYIKHDSIRPFLIYIFKENSDGLEFSGKDEMIFFKREKQLKLSGSSFSKVFDDHSNEYKEVRKHLFISTKKGYYKINPQFI